MSEKAKKGMTPAYIINSIITVALMIGFRFLPPVGSVTPYGMEILGIFLGSIYGWVTVSFVWPSFLGMVVLGLTKYGTFPAVLGEGFSNSTVLMILFTFVFFAYISKTGLMQYMANKIISMKMNIGHPWRLIFSIFFVASFVAGLTNNIAVTLLLWFLFYSICNQVGYKPGDMFVSYIVCGVVFFATFSIVIFPFLPFALAGIGIMSAMANFGDFSVTGWMVAGPVCTIILIIGYMLLGKFVFRVDVSKLADTTDRFADLRNTKLGKTEKVGLIYMVLFLIFVLLPVFLPKTNPLYAVINGFSVTGCCVLLLTGVTFFKNDDGKFAVPISDLMKGVNWDMILLLVATIPICTAMEGQDTGIIPSLMTVVMPLLSMVSPIVFMAIALLIIIVITQFAHNMILLLVFGPVLAQILSQYGVPPIVFCAVFMMVIQTAVATPGASANSAMLFGNTEWVDNKQALILGWSFVTMAILVYIFVAIPINMFFAG